MQSQTRLFVALCVLATAAACQKAQAPADQPIDYAKSFKQSLTPFIATGTEMELSTVSLDAQSRMLDCDVPTTETRIKGDSLTTSYKVISRSRESVDSHFQVRDEDMGFSTKTKGSIYSRTYTLNHLSIDNLSALSQGPLSYTDSCTKSGCDEKQRSYLAGSASYLIEVDANVRKILHDMDDKAKKACTFKSIGGRTKESVVQGSYSLGGVDYKAVKYLLTEEGDLYCSGSTIDEHSQSVYMGKATRTRTAIALADQLPQIRNEISNVGAPSPLRVCDRTQVVQSEFIESDGKIYVGSAQEIVRATITADIRTVDQFKKDKKDRQDRIQRLQDAVTLAQNDKNNADFQVSSAQVDLSSAKSANDVAQNDSAQADAIASRPNATPAEKANAVLKKNAAQAAADNVTRAQALLDSKQALASMAAKKLQEAQTALTQAQAEDLALN